MANKLQVSACRQELLKTCQPAYCDGLLEKLQDGWPTGGSVMLRLRLSVARLPYLSLLRYGYGTRHLGP